MSISVGGLANLCSSNLVELRFTRRDKRRRPTTRRMLCTIDFKLLNSPLGKQLLNFKKPFNRPPYNAAQKGLVTVWDCLLHGWRNIDIKSAVIIQKESEDSLPIYVNDQKGIEAFAKFYNTKLAKMNTRKFMDT